MFNAKKKGENEIDDRDLFAFTRYKPGGLDHLCKATKFSKKEIRQLYQGFKQQCPTGVVSEDAFKNIFSQFFPQGDATAYAHLVFKTFKQHYSNTGNLNFEQFLSVLSALSRGTVEDKLKWIFGLYDINGDGYITKQEMLTIVRAIYDMLGNYTEPLVDEHTAKEHVERIFHQIDADEDGVISFEDFSQWCQKDENRAQSLLMLDTVFS